MSGSRNTKARRSSSTVTGRVGSRVPILTAELPGTKAPKKAKRIRPIPMGSRN